MEARVDVRKLQILNDRINQTLDALNQVRMSVHGLGHTSGQGMSNPYGPQSQLGTQAGFGQPGWGQQQAFGQQGFGQSPFTGQQQGWLGHSSFQGQQIPFLGSQIGLQGGQPIDPRLFRGGLNHPGPGMKSHATPGRARPARRGCCRRSRTRSRSRRSATCRTDPGCPRPGRRIGGAPRRLASRGLPTNPRL